MLIDAMDSMNHFGWTFINAFEVKMDETDSFISFEPFYETDYPGITGFHNKIPINLTI